MSKATRKRSARATSVDQAHMMLTRAKVARLADVSERRVDYWARTGLLSATVDEKVNGGQRVRLLDFTDAMTVLVLASLRERVSLQHIRQIVSYLRDLNYQVTEVRFAIAGDQVHFQTPDGIWSGVRDPEQIVLHDVLNLEPLRQSLFAAAHRARETVGQIERRRGALGSKPVLAGTRIPVRTVQTYLEHGSTIDEILEAYPSLQREDVEAVRALASA